MLYEYNERLLLRNEQTIYVLKYDKMLYEYNEKLLLRKEQLLLAYEERCPSLKEESSLMDYLLKEIH